MHIDIRILVFKPTIMTASESLPVFIPQTQLGEGPANSTNHRKLTLSSFCRALVALMFWYVVISLCVRLI